MIKLIKIGTHATPEEITLANQVAALIKPSGYTTEIVTLPKSTTQENALLNGTIDIVIRQAAEVAPTLPDEIELIAFSERQRVHDLWVTTTNTINLRTSGIHVGVTDKRAAAFLKHLNPDAKVAIINNMDLEITNLLTGKHHALILSSDLEHFVANKNLVREPIETSYFVPAAGAGSVAVLCHKKMPFAKKEVLQRWVNHEETEDCIRTERSFISAMEDQKNEIVFAYAHFEGALITLKAGIISADGQQVIKTKKSSTLADSKELGKKVAIEILETAAAN